MRSYGGVNGGVNGGKNLFAFGVLKKRLRFLGFANGLSHTLFQKLLLKFFERVWFISFLLRPIALRGTLAKIPKLATKLLEARKSNFFKLDKSFGRAFLKARRRSHLPLFFEKRVANGSVCRKTKKG